MTTIILVILGVLLAGAAALMMIFYGGDVFGKYSTEAEAARLVSEGSQIESAVELYYRNNDRYPVGQSGESAIKTLIDSDYLTHAPKGNPNGNPAGQWVIDYDEGQIRSSVGPFDDEEALLVCRTARQQLKLPDPEAVYKCDGSDAPGGTLSSREPCYIRG